LEKVESVMELSYEPSLDMSSEQWLGIIYFVAKAKPWNPSIPKSKCFPFTMLFEAELVLLVPLDRL
jgi:hypothetical protein